MATVKQVDEPKPVRVKAQISENQPLFINNITNNYYGNFVIPMQSSK
jgi:hypothetical protein